MADLLGKFFIEKLRPCVVVSHVLWATILILEVLLQVYSTWYILTRQG